MKIILKNKEVINADEINFRHRDMLFYAAYSGVSGSLRLNEVHRILDDQVYDNEKASE